MASLNPGDICPKCGQPISWIEAYKNKKTGKKYYYAIHYLGKYRKTNRGIKPLVKKCYLGPEQYTYVTKQHHAEKLQLKGMNETDRLLEYLKTILENLNTQNLTETQKKTLQELLEKTLDKLKS